MSLCVSTHCWEKPSRYELRDDGLLMDAHKDCAPGRPPRQLSTERRITATHAQHLESATGSWLQPGSVWLLQAFAESMGRWRIVSLCQMGRAGQGRKEEKAKKQANSRGVSRLDTQRTRQAALKTAPAPAPRGLVNQKWRRQAAGSSPDEILVAKAENHTVPNTTVPNTGRRL